MLAAIPQPLEVHQVGSSTFLESLAGPFLIAVAAIIAASLAALVARRNHAEQLANDRELRDLDHVRRSVGAAVETIQEAIHALTSLDTAVQVATEAREATEDAKVAREGHVYEGSTPTLGAMREKENEMIEGETATLRAENKSLVAAREKRSAFNAVQSRLLSDTLRLRIALGDKSAVVISHAELVESLSEWGNRLQADSADGQFRIDPDSDARVTLIQKPLRRFITAAQRWSADQDTLD